MRKFAEVYPDFPKSQRVVGFLPWRNNITLMTKVKDETVRQWYIEQNIENGRHIFFNFRPEYETVR